MNKELAMECIKTQRQFVDDRTKEAFDMAIEALKQPCEDAVSREAVLKTVDEWYDNNLEVENIEDLIVALTYMPSVQPTAKENLVVDAVSREAVMALAKEECETAIIPYKRFIKGVNALPPAIPAKTKGEWIESEFDESVYCSECNAEYESKYRFCPNCGADMRGDE